MIALRIAVLVMAVILGCMRAHAVHPFPFRFPELSVHELVRLCLALLACVPAGLMLAILSGKSPALCGLVATVFALAGVIVRKVWTS